jgi:hypothetical protein
MAISYSASEDGLQRVDDARRKLGWNRDDDRWLEAARVSRATLYRFLAGERVTKQKNFEAICQAVGIDRHSKNTAVFDLMYHVL